MIGPLRETPLRVVLRRSFIVLYLLTIAVGVAGFVAVTVVNQRLDTLAVTLEPLAGANADILQDMTNAETGVRGYQQTGQAAFLAPYRQGVADLPAATARATTLAAGHAAVQRLLQAQSAAASRWLRGFAAPAGAAGRRVGPGAAASGAEAPEAGKALFDSFRSANAAVARRVDRDILRAHQAGDADRHNALMVLAALMVVAAGAGAQSGLRVVRSLAPPLERVAGALRRMASGERDVRLAEEGTVEMAALSRAVNRLAEESERRAVAERRSMRTRALGADVGRQLRQHLDLSAVLDGAVRALASAFDIQRVIIRLAVDGTLGPVAAQWQAPGVVPYREDREAPAAVLAACEALRAGGAPVVILNRDAADAPGAPGGADQQYLAHMDAHGSAICPLVTDGELVGAMSLIDTAGPIDWDPSAVAALEAVAADLGRAISHAHLYEGQQRLVGELEALDAAKDRFVSTVSHELRTPLTSIRGYAEMLLDGDGGELTPEAVRMIAVIDRNASRLRNLIEDLLTLSRLQSPSGPLDSVPVDVDVIAEAAMSVVAPQAAAAGLEVRHEPGARGAQVAGDPTALERVLLNLLSNAVKFTPAGGRVTLRTLAAGTSVAVEVTDTGIGIPADDLARIGDRFFRAANATAGAIPGTGLGLSIVRSVVEQHGGSVEFSSRQGQGTKVALTLPVVPAASPAR